MRYIKHTEKYFHRKVGSSTVLFPTVTTTMGTLRSRPPQQMARESSLVKPAPSVGSGRAPGWGHCQGQEDTGKLLCPFWKPLQVFPSGSVIVLYRLILTLWKGLA